MEKQTTQNGQFELPTDSASLQTRQAAAFNYMKGFLIAHFKTSPELTTKNLEFMNRQIKRLFDLDLL